MNVLFVEDDDGIRLLFVAIGTTNGWECQTRASIEDITHADREWADAMVLDHELPGLHGLALLEDRAVNEHWPPIVMVTGDHDIAYDARQAGAVGFLTKPFDAMDLVTAVQDVAGPQPVLDLTDKAASPVTNAD